MIADCLWMGETREEGAAEPASRLCLRSALRNMMADFVYISVYSRFNCSKKIKEKKLFRSDSCMNINCTS